MYGPNQKVVGALLRRYGSFPIGDLDRYLVLGCLEGALPDEETVLRIHFNELVIGTNRRANLPLGPRLKVSPYAAIHNRN